MLNKEITGRLRVCFTCRKEAFTSETTCSCSSPLIVVVFSSIDGSRITPEVPE